MAIYRGPGGAGDATADATNAASVAEGFADDAATSAASAAGSASSALTAKTAAEAAQTAAEAAQTAAELAETNAETAVTNAETAETNAVAAQTAAETAKLAAETAETNAESARDAALAAQTAAELAETNAETAETSAIAAKNAAESARDATLAAYDNFDDRYLGAKSSNPTLDNDGNALVAGALYFNSTAGEMRIYTGSAWVAAYVSGAGFLASANNLSDVTNAATARQNLDLEIGVDVQAYDAATVKTDVANTFTETQTFDIINAVDVNGIGGQVVVQSSNNGAAYVQLNETGNSYVGAASSFIINSDGDTQSWEFGSDGVLYAPGGTVLLNSDIGVSVQAYDADTAKTDVAQTFTVSQRGTVTTDNDGSFDLNVTNNFKCTPTGAITLTFTNITAGQSGFILLINGSNYTVSAHANTKVSTTALATISATGSYILSYFSDGTNVYVVNSGALA